MQIPSQIKVNIELTWSKIIALLILIFAVYLDSKSNGIAVFMFSIPFVVVLITGKQLNDVRKLHKPNSNQDENN